MKISHGLLSSGIRSLKCIGIKANSGILVSVLPEMVQFKKIAETTKSNYKEQQKRYVHALLLVLCQ